MAFFATGGENFNLFRVTDGKTSHILFSKHSAHYSQFNYFLYFLSKFISRIRCLYLRYRLLGCIAVGVQLVALHKGTEDSTADHHTFHSPSLRCSPGVYNTVNLASAPLYYINKTQTERLSKFY
jgi:hypothetical protein